MIEQFSVMKALMLVAAWLLHAVAAAPDNTVYAQCEPVTRFVPVTYMVTVTAPATAPISSSDAVTVRTITSTSTSTVRLSQLPDPISAASISVDQLTYSFVVQSGRTSWYGSSPNTGLSLTTITTTIYVMPSTTLSVIPTTTVATVTIEPPPYVTTSYTMVDSTSTSTVTRTRTTTTVVTNTFTRTRTAFSPPGSFGWNSTAGSPIEGASYAATTESVDGVPTTITGTVYWSIGTQITSTSLTTLTLTLTRSRNSTSDITPEGSTLIATETAAVTSVGITVASSQTFAESAQGRTSLSPQSIPISFSTGQSSVTAAVIRASDVVSPSYGGVSFNSYSSSTSPSVMTAASNYDPSSMLSLSSTLATADTLTQTASTAVFQSTRSILIDPFTASSPIASPGNSLLISPPPELKSATIPSGFSTSFISQPTLSSVTTLISISAILPPSSTMSASSGGVFIGSSALPVSVVFASRQSLASQGILTSILAPPSALPTRANTDGQSTQASVAANSTTAAFPTSTNSPSSSVPYSTRTEFRGLSLNSSITTLADSERSATYPASALPITTSLDSTGSSNAISPTPSVCGEHGNFTLGFDDLPSFMPNQTVDITQAPPIFNGYHHLAFSNGYVYAPPPRDPFPPVSQPHLAVFLGNASGNGTNNTPTAMAPISGMIRPGEFGNGISDSVSAFWFNGYSTWIGCDNPGPEPCTYVVTAYAWNATTLSEEEIDTQNLTTSGCPGYQNCRLEQVAFPQTFRRLSGLQIQAYRGPDQVMFFMDDVQLGWYNNTCAAGLQRLRSQRGGTPVRRSPRLPKY